MQLYCNGKLQNNEAMAMAMEQWQSNVLNNGAMTKKLAMENSTYNSYNPHTSHGKLHIQLIANSTDNSMEQWQETENSFP